MTRICITESVFTVVALTDHEVRFELAARKKARDIGNKIEWHLDFDALLGPSFWEISKQYPECTTDKYHIDILAIL